MFKKDNDEYIWSNKRLKSFEQSNSIFFKNKIRESNLFRAKTEIKERRMKQLKQNKNLFTKKFRKIAKTLENKKINEKTRVNLIYQFIVCKIDKFMFKMKKARLAIEDKIVKLIRKQVANEIVNKKQFALWLKSTKTFRTRVEKLKRQNRSLKTKNNIFKTYLDDLEVNTEKLLRLAKKKRAAKSKKRKNKKMIIRSKDHDFLFSKTETQDFDTAFEN